MKLQIRVDASGMWWDGGAIVDVSDPLTEAFEPLRTTDEAMVSFATGDIMANSAEARRVVKLREGAAKILADEIATHLIREMGKRDTHNGY